VIEEPVSREILVTIRQAIRKAGMIWSMLTEPRSTTLESERYRARLLLTLLVSVAAVMFGAVIFIAFSPAIQAKRDFLILIATATFLFCLFLVTLARAGRYYTTILLAVIFYFGIATLCIIQYKRLEMASYLILGLLFTGLFLTPRMTIQVTLTIAILNGVYYLYLPEIARNQHLLIANLAICTSSGILLALATNIQRSNERQILSQTEQLSENAAQLQTWAADLEMRNYMMDLSTSMSQEIQSARSQTMVYAAVKRYAAELFPGSYDVIYRLLGIEEELTPEVAWGEGEVDHPAIPVVTCQAFQKRRVYRHDSCGCCLASAHSNQLEGMPYTCLPLVAQEEILGVLHIRGLSDDGSQMMASTAADYIALAISNLRLRETLKEQATRDPLTGLYNRRSLEERLRQEIARSSRSRRNFSLVMVDIDHFKNFNDAYGHDTGDHVLRLLAIFLQTHFRSSDIVCRYGGEEFTVILPEASLAGAMKRADEVREAVSTLEMSYRDQPLHRLTISMGVAVYPEHGQDQESLFRAADAALYTAKSSGRNRTVAASAAHEEEKHALERTTR
jgi:diguanylate cyclase (GGDEF)-like protein